MRSFGFAFVGSVALMAVACGGSSNEPMPSPKPQIASLVPEGPSKDCPAGGTRIFTGDDVDGNGKVDMTEAKATQVVCNGKDGVGPAAVPVPLMNVEVENAGVNCASGGVKISMGTDKDGNGVLGAPEVATTKFVCNGDASRGANVVTVLDSNLAPSSGVNAFTGLEAKIAAPGKGKVIALSNMDIFCASPALNAGYDCAAGITAGYYALTTDPAFIPNMAQEYFYLTPNATENSARTAVFDVAAAGDVTVYIRARAATGQLGLFRRSLTLIFIPG